MFCPFGLSFFRPGPASLRLLLTLLPFCPFALSISLSLSLSLFLYLFSLIPSHPPHPLLAAAALLRQCRCQSHPQHWRRSRELHCSQSRGQLKPVQFASGNCKI
ncbi:hypothetical protein IWZ00DRAFT_379141 [Phyllosticta capitalensis]